MEKMNLNTIIIFLIAAAIFITIIVTYHLNKKIDIAAFKKTNGFVISSQLYKNNIKNYLNNTSSNIQTVTTNKHWTFTVTYTYSIDGRFYFAVNTIMANELTSPLFKKILKKTDLDDLSQLLIDYVPNSEVAVYYNPTDLEDSFLEGFNSKGLSINTK